MSRPIVSNVSHLQKVTSPSHGIPSQSQIPKKLTSPTESSLNHSIVNSFLNSVNARENSTRNNGQMFKSHQTLKLSTPSSDSSTNQFGLRRVNGSESAVQNRVKNFNREEPENVVVYRTKSTTDRNRAFGTTLTTSTTTTPPPSSQQSRAETPERNFLSDDRKWKAKYEDAERRRKEMLSESQKRESIPSLFFFSFSRTRRKF